MTTLPEEVSSEQPNGLGAEAAALPLLPEEDVDGRVTVVGFEFFVVLDAACDLARDFDDQQDFWPRSVELLL